MSTRPVRSDARRANDAGGPRAFPKGIAKDGIDLSEYATPRLRIYLDATGRVEELNCG